MWTRRIALGLLLLPGCAPDSTARNWLQEQVPAGARLLVEGQAHELVEDRPGVERVSSVADLPASELEGYEFILLDSRVYGPNLKRRKHRAPIYRALVRDPAYEPLALHESWGLGGRVKLLLLRRRATRYLEVASRPLALDAGRASASLTVEAPLGLFLLRSAAPAAEPGAGVWSGDRLHAFRPGATGLETEPFLLERGAHTLRVDAAPAGELLLVELLALEALEGSRLFEDKARLLGLLEAEAR